MTIVHLGTTHRVLIYGNERELRRSRSKVDATKCLTTEIRLFKLTSAHYFAALSLSLSLYSRCIYALVTTAFEQCIENKHVFANNTSADHCAAARSLILILSQTLRPLKAAIDAGDQQRQHPVPRYERATFIGAYNTPSHLATERQQLGC